MTTKRKLGAGLVAVSSLAAVLVGSGQADATTEVERSARVYEVTVEITNLAPANGTSQTPVWVGVHDGSFDLYDRGATVSPELERLAEDGNIAPLSAAFAASGAGTDATAPGPSGPIGPGETATVSFVMSPERHQPQYLSYASMVLPSNDAFVANGDPTAHRIFTPGGRFQPTRFVVAGGEVLDAGSEVNDELPANTAFFGQMTPDTGVVEGGVVELHPGFNDPAAGGILADPRFANADFTAHGYEMLAFDVTARRLPSRVYAPLKGELEVLPVDTDAKGRVTVKLEEDGDIQFWIKARRIDDLLFAHIHIAPPGSNGPVAVALFNGDPSSDGRLHVTGEVGSADLVGPLAGMTTLDLWQEILAGNAYVNVHSTDFPGGELRGNLTGS